MKILALDTSGQHASAALLQTKEDECFLIGEISLNARHGDKSYTHSEILMPGVEKLFKLTGQKLEEFTHIAYTCGPGSFTGLRIGASTALGIANALNVPSVAVPTLDALFYNVYGMGFAGDVCPVMDARRGQVYFALFDCNNEKIVDYEALEPVEIIQKLRGDTLFVGEGVDIIKKCLQSDDFVNKNEKFRAVFSPAHHNFTKASSAGVWVHKNQANIKNQEHKMIYVRPPQAEHKDEPVLQQK